MRPDGVTEVHRSQVSEFIAEKTGLHFPPERWMDLERGLGRAAEEFGLGDVDTCVDWLLRGSLTKAQLQVLASHLTVGETYFFREKKAFDALAGTILPGLICARRNREQRLRLWSAACCTGEEAYSLAILLHQIIPDLPDWHVTILATDINPRFLQKAAAGVYGEWSFREAPAGLKERYFHRTTDGLYVIRPEFKKQVTFANLNLVEDLYPALATNTNGMDVIFCRNVLMYFTLPQAEKVAWNLCNSLVEDGWLVAGPSEGPQTLFSQFVPVYFPDIILHQKSDKKVRTARSGTPSTASSTEASPLKSPPSLALPPAESPPVLPAERSANTKTPPAPQVEAALLYQQGRYEEAADTLLKPLARHAAPDPPTFSLLARALANQGKLADALTWCDRWVAGDKLNPSGHYLRAMVLLELGNHDLARSSLQRAVYLDPDFVLAHFALGNLARNRGKNHEADKHFANTSHLLLGHKPDDLLPESEGLTAGRLAEIIFPIPVVEATP